MIRIRYQHVVRGEEPAPPTEVDRPGCNFCDIALPRKWTDYPSATFTRQARLTDGAGTVHITYSGTWEACRKCSPLVDAANWARLAMRMTATIPQPPQYTAADHRNEMRDLLAALAEHIGVGVPAQRPRGSAR